jgi:NADH-quinone oxidoreductase subunit L
VEVILILLLLFPLVGAVINAVSAGRLPRGLSGGVASLAVLGALAMAATGFVLLGERTLYVPLVDWVTVGKFSASITLLYNPLAAVMALMVTFVSSIIHLYSVSFMREDEDYCRYFCYLNLFVFSMLVITLSDNLLFFYLGWEGVGFCSYALVGFWYQDPAKATAGRKAFIVTRIGDVAFGIAIALIFFLFGSLSLTYIYSHLAALTPGMATVLGLLLLWAAMGKSAQLPLTVWLPDAMAGPTPVSALIHAATMVTAGAYLLMRAFPVISLSPLALATIAGVGAVTTLYGAAGALGQRDIKRVLAYSTISQVGYMVLAVGAADIIGGMFHLLSHAFFKSLLFMCAGYVIQALDEEHDIFKMGNLRRLLPHIFWPFLIGALCLSAFPMVGGFFSKDRILLATFIGPGFTYKVFWALALLAAFLTPLYTFRMFFLVFQDRPGGRTPEEIKPVPSFMAYILWPLALLALFDGMLNLPFGPGKRWLGHYLSVVAGTVVDLPAPPGYELYMGVGSAAVIVAVLIFTYYLYRPPGPTFNAPSLEAFLFEGLYLDKLYLYLFAGPYQRLAEFWWQSVDEGGIDRGLDGAADSVELLSRGLGFWATGRLSTYVKMLLVGLTVFFSALALRWYLW